MSACLNCGNSELQIWSQVFDEEYGTRPGEKAIYLHCNKCETISLSETLENQLEAIYPSNYYSYANENYGLLYRIKFWLDRRFYKNNLPKFKKEELVEILDIGGGAGEVLTNFARQISSNQVQGTIIDLDPSARIFAENNGYVYRQESFLYADFQNKKFDVILAFNILEHVENPNKFLSICEYILKENGIIVLQTPNWHSLDARIFRNKYWGGLHAPRHFCIYSVDSLVKALANHNLKVVKHIDALAGPFWAFSILASIPNRNSRNRFPLYQNRLFSGLVVVFSVFDFIRRIFVNTSQQLLIIKKV